MAVTKIVKFTANNCRYCSMLESSLSELSFDVKIKTVNISELTQEEIDKLGLMGVPVLRFYDENGKQLGESLGYKTAHELAELIRGL